MPENVTGFQPTGNLTKSPIDLAYFDMLPRPSPTFFREEPKSLTRPASALLDISAGLRPRRQVRLFATPVVQAFHDPRSRVPSSLSDWGLISMCQQFCCGLSG